MAHEYERDEWGSAVAGLSELERAQTCEHAARQGARPCPDCNDEVFCE